LPVTPADVGVPAIPITPVAVAPAALAPMPVSPAPSPPSAQSASAASDPAAQVYRAALADLAARRLEPALLALDGFLRDHPRHPYASNAMYWRAEIHYVRRDYARALGEFSALIERFPRGGKAPEALLRIGLCHQRMGRLDRAQEAFGRLRAQFPDSVAARMVPREDV
jgi:tol-pal system protein YbgF